MIQKAKDSPSPGRKLAKPSAIRACSGCGGPITREAVSYCQTNAVRFAGELLCRACQKTVPPLTAAVKSGGLKNVETCEGCGVIVEPNVANFSRVNSRKFGGRVLCRICQTSGPM